MTEAGKQWLKSKTGEASSFDEAEAEFWLTAFVRLVREEADMDCAHCQESHPEDVGNSFAAIAQRFGLEGK